MLQFLEMGRLLIAGGAIVLLGCFLYLKRTNEYPHRKRLGTTDDAVYSKAELRKMGFEDDRWKN